MLDTIDLHDFSTVILVDQTPRAAFDAIINPRAWWGQDIDGNTDTLGEEWSYRYKDIHYSKHRTVELVPGRKVVWHVVDGTLNFVKDKSEWQGTDLVFDIAEKDGKTEVRFTHRGLVPTVECFDACSSGWSGLITRSLRNLIESGGGTPDDFE
ncbi:MAG: ATPase [Devosia sp.]|uniref:SRPBCC family protein n=1 Tax=Devosia sp. TaxID=1871048 RepID=UPI0026393D60|nr:SRPBCC domain-containing protein [Devosia sp.]MDB5541416.1 ATPase [Devosia sp.]